MKIIAKTPGTCGEYIQGIWRNEPCLVSAPINIFSEVTIEDGNGEIDLKPKAQKLLFDFFYKYNIPIEQLNNINIHINSKIPIENGFGSSTADLCGLIKGLAEFFFVELNEKELAKFLIKVDPTDNIMFKELNLFNHYSGEIYYNFNTFIKGEVLIITNLNSTINTIELGYLDEFKKDQKIFKKIIDTFYEGCLKKDLEIIGKATTESAIQNQLYLPKSNLEKIIDLTFDNNGFGILIGHSGNLIGILKDDNFNEDNFIQAISNLNEYKDQSLYNFDLIQGGVHIERIFDSYPLS